MSKKLKKLLCGLLACAMLAGSGVAALADETDTDAAASAEEASSVDYSDLADRGNEEETEGVPGADEEAVGSAAEATEAPAEETEATQAPEAEATEAPEAEATEAPEAEATAEPTAAPTVSAYENDAYYKKALSLCTALGIITGYEDGSVKPDSTVTRAEMAAIVLRILNTEPVAYRNLYTDVNSSHWAADTIEAATEKNIVDGYEDSTFRPDDEVLYEQVAKMLVCAMNYEAEAKVNGGWPTGYTRVAQQNLKLFSNVTSKLGDGAPRGDVIKMVYNALLGPYKELAGNDKNGNPTYTADNTLAYAMFDITEGVGIVTATSKKALSGDTVNDGQIKIEGIIYECTVEDVDDYVGKKVTYYYIDNLTSDQTIVSMYSDSSKTETVVIDADDIDTVTGIAATSPNGQIKTKGKSKTTYKMAEGLQVLYNGTVITPDIYMAARDSDKSNRFKSVSVNGTAVTLGAEKEYIKFITPDVGTVTLIDYDTDGKYDVMDVMSYETLLVSSASEDSVKGTIDKVKSTTIDTNNDAGDKTITVIKNGSEVKPRNLRKNDVASVARNLDGTILTIEVTGESITGEVTDVSTNEKDNGGVETIVIVSGVEYKVDLNAIEDCKAGSEGTFYTDKFDRIGYAESSSSGKLSSSEKYGWIMSMFASDDNTDVMVKMYTQDGSVQTYKLSGTISYWASDATSAEKVSKNIFIARADSNKTITLDYIYRKDRSSSGYDATDIPVRLVKYKVNSQNEITELYLATDSEENSNDNGVIVNVNNQRNQGAAGSFINGYMLEDGGIEFNVPASNSDMSTASGYSVASVAASQYLNVEGVGRDFLLAEFKDSRYPQVVIRYSSSGGTTLSPITDYGTANDNPTMMITSIGYGKDEDNEDVFTIKGYSGGAMVSYTTCSTTGVYHMAYSDGELGGSIMATKEEYIGENIYDATKDNSSVFYNALSVGDVVGIQSSGSTANVIIKMVDAKNIVRDGGTAKTQWLGDTSFSTTRDRITIGKVASAELEGAAFITVGSTSVSFDSGKVLDAVVVTLDENGNVVSTKVDKDGGYDIVDVENGIDDSDYTDYAMVRQFKGGMREIFIIRAKTSN